MPFHAGPHRAPSMSRAHHILGHMLCARLHACAEAACAQYGVTSKVVRDIWNRITWVRSLPTPLQIADSLPPSHSEPARAGRPFGSKQSMGE